MQSYEHAKKKTVNWGNGGASEKNLNVRRIQKIFIGVY